MTSSGSLNSVLRGRLLGLANRLGVPYDFRSRRRKDPLWDGRQAHFAGLKNADIAHELAHWMVSPQRLRSEENFGLGSDFAGGEAVPRIPKQEAYTCEVLTCYLQAFIFESLGASMRQVLEPVLLQGVVTQSGFLVPQGKLNSGSFLRLRRLTNTVRSMSHYQRLTKLGSLLCTPPLRRGWRDFLDEEWYMRNPVRVWHELSAKQAYDFAKKRAKVDLPHLEGHVSQQNKQLRGKILEVPAEEDFIHLVLKGDKDVTTYWLHGTKKDVAYVLR